MDEDGYGIDIDNLDNLLDFVYEGITDISPIPSQDEYRKLKRIMRCMTRFYQKGSDAKLDQKLESEKELRKLGTDTNMCNAQLEALKAFPQGHPKCKRYVTNLTAELEMLERRKPDFEKRTSDINRLYEWSKGVAAAVEWLGGNIEEYCNVNLSMSPALAEKPAAYTGLTREQLEVHKRAIDEITYNIQESQDFFEASVDGRLKSFHQIEKCMIQAQLKVLEAFPPMNERKIHEEEELQKDLKYCEDVMEEDNKPKRQVHKEKMRQLHKDFFQVLRWQRARLKEVLGITGEDEPKRHDVLGEGTPVSNGKANGEANGHSSVVAPHPLGGGVGGSCPMGYGKSS